MSTKPQKKASVRAKPIDYEMALKRAEKQVARLQELFSEIRHSDGSPVFNLTPEQQWQFTHYIRLLLEWNQRIDLISPNDEERFAERHVLESLAPLSVWSFIVGTSVLDLGSGGGLPGIPLKIMCPDLAMTLLESKRRKAFFITHAMRYLGLWNCRIFNERAEQLDKSRSEHFEVVIARAVADLRKLWRWSRPLLVSGGVLLAMKGGDIDEELQALKKFDPEACYRVLRYPVEWKVDPSRCFVVVADNLQSLNG